MEMEKRMKEKMFWKSEVFITSINSQTQWSKNYSKTETEKD